MSYCLDASALLAVLLDEPGADVVSVLLGEAGISAVNYSEVAGKLLDRAARPETVARALAPYAPLVEPFDLALAEQAALLRPATRRAGLSLGDRACLALATAHAAVAVTADRAWADLDLGVTITVIR